MVSSFVPVARVNGKDCEVDEGTTIPSLLAAIGVAPRMVVVERNGRVVFPEDWDKTGIENGDEIEVVTFVGGG